MKNIITMIVIGLMVASCAATPKVEATPKPKSSKELILASADAHGVPRHVAEYVARKESTFRCSTPGRYNGPLQISHGSARALGYTKAEGNLNSCGAGLKYGMRHLALCVRKVGADPKKAARCHASPARYGVRVAWR